MGDRYSGRSPPRRGPPPGRDRFPARDRDDHPNVEYFGAGESYRPGGQTGDGPYRPARDRDNDRYNPPAAPDRRDDRRRDEIDSYIPPTSSRAQRARSRSPPPYRRRSRSPPPGRGRPELFPDRAARSPPRRFSPPRDRARSPVRRRSRSPYNARARSPSPKRDRFESPPRNRFNDRPRSPPRRPLSPDRNSYRPRSRTPPRPNYADERWRRRSPSPRGSANTSRRSSPPPIHPDRLSLAGSRPHSPARDRSRYDDRDRRDDDYPSRPRSPPRRDDYPERERDKSPEDIARDRDDYSTPAPPTGPRGAGYARPPPSGPARSYTSQTPPPASAPSTSMSAHNRPATFAPPSGPRGAGPPRDFTSPPAALRGRTSLTYRAPGYRPPLPNQPPSFEAPSPAPPSGPRAASYSSRGDFSSSRGDFSSSRGGSTNYPTGPSRTTSSTQPSSDYPYRPNNSTAASGTYPRTQRFNGAPPSGPPTGPSSLTTTFSHDGRPTSTTTASPATVTPATPANFVKSQLSTLERIVPGGRHTPGSAHSTTGFTADQERKMKQLEDDAERIRSEIGEKQKNKREALREWEVRERESEIAGLRSELAEGTLRTFEMEAADEGMVGAAF